MAWRSPLEGWRPVGTAAGGTITGAVTITGALTAQSTVNLQGAVDCDSTVNIDGALTARSTANIQGAADFDSTVNVDGAQTNNAETKHGDRVLSLFWPLGSYVSQAESGVPAVACLEANASTDTATIPIPLKTGDRIRSIKVHHNRAGGTMTFTLYRSNQSATMSSVASGSVAAGTGISSTTISSIDHTILANNFYVLHFTQSDTSLNRIWGIEVTYDRP